MEFVVIFAILGLLCATVAWYVAGGRAPAGPGSSLVILGALFGGLVLWGIVGVLSESVGAPSNVSWKSAVDGRHCVVGGKAATGIDCADTNERRQYVDVVGEQADEASIGPIGLFVMGALAIAAFGCIRVDVRWNREAAIAQEDEALAADRRELGMPEMGNEHAVNAPSPLSASQVQSERADP